MSSLLIDVWTSLCSLRKGTGGCSWGEVCLLLSEKAEACFHVLPCHIRTALLLPLLLLTVGLWYVVALASVGCAVTEILTGTRIKVDETERDLIDAGSSIPHFCKLFGLGRQSKYVKSTITNRIAFNAYLEKDGKLEVGKRAARFPSPRD